MKSKYVAAAVVFVSIATIAGTVSFANQRSSEDSEGSVETPDTTPAPTTEFEAVATTTTLPSSTAGDSDAEAAPSRTLTTTPPELSIPSPEEVGRPRASNDEVLATYGAFEIRKLVATGAAADGGDWWTTTWNRTLPSGATVWCLGSPSGAACWDDAFLPASAPAVALAIGGWPPDVKVLVAPAVTVSGIEIDGVSTPFEQESLDLPSGRSIVALPLPNRSVDIVVRFVADSRDGTLDIPFEAEFEEADLGSLATPDRLSIEYGPMPGMAVGETTTPGQ
jgi:hypothetical protein